MLNAMQAEGLNHPGDLIPDGVIHRFTPPEDRPGSQKAWYILFPSEPPAGAFGRWVADHNHKTTWCGKVTKKLTAEEKKALAVRMAEAQRLVAEETARLQAECAAWCAEAWEAAPEADPAHPYLVRKQIRPHGARQHAEFIMVPCSIAGKITGIQFIAPDGSKKFKRNSVKQGACFLIGAITPTVVIAEGFATGASIHEATGYAVLVAFDAGNLQAVAETARKRLPDADLVIACDNDAWAKVIRDGVTEYRPVPCNVDGKQRVNTGVVRGKEAAAAVKARVLVPTFANVETHPTDFNDLHILEGIEAVARAFAHRDEYEPMPEEDDHVQPCEDAPEPPPVRELRDDNPFFLYLGYDHDKYFYMPHSKLQVTSLSAPEHTEANLNALAPLNFWEMECSSKKGVNWSMARDMMLRKSESRGLYSANNIRGRGAWWDDKRSVLHMGNKLVVDGEEQPLKKFRSKFIYETSQETMFDNNCRPLDNDESGKFLDLCKMLSWEKPMSAYFLAGWCVLAPICGALSWRPHVWLTGSHGTGKSTICNDIIRPSVGTSALIVQGSTTEAGIRQDMMHDARPVIFDEAEGEEHDDRKRIQKIIELARQSSSESTGQIIKGSQGGKAVRFSVRSMFCFASIGISTKQAADQSRITTLGLVKNERRQHTFDDIKAMINATTVDPEYNMRLRARTIKLLPQIMENSRQFIRAIAERTNQRTGDQVGWLLAGVFSLTSPKVIAMDYAREWVAERDWSDQVVAPDQADELRCLNKIITSLIQENGSTLSVWELLGLATREDMLFSGEDKTKHSAQKTLERHGIKVEFTDMFMISNTHSGIAHILKDTPWATNWGNILSRVPGAHKHPTSVRIGGAVSRATAIPLHYAVKGEE